MFEVLFGNKNVERVLIFLFVNNRGYGAQIARLFNIPLTPLQKALSRLERGGVITSFYEGKTRVYRFSEGFLPLLELKELIKKIYNLLPAEEKRLFYVGTQSSAQEKGGVQNARKVLLEFWERLACIQGLKLTAHSKSKAGLEWKNRGEGSVRVTREGENTLLFEEKGIWGERGDQVSKGSEFTNSFCWKLDRTYGVISLEHLRRGPNEPVFLFDLAPSTSSCLSSVHPHLCGADSYFGQVHLDPRTLRLHWRVIGPKKDERIEYCYF